MNKTYIKSILRDIKKTKGKVFSIMVMVGLATMVVVGLYLSGPSMRKSLNNSLVAYKHPDLIVRSTYGLDYEDESLLKTDKEIEQINFIKAIDLRDKDKIIRLKEYDSNLPKLIITEGSLPKNPDELILDYKLKEHYKLGDKIDFSYINSDQKKDFKMKRLAYRVVGFFKSSDYFMEDMKEISPIGKSELSGFAYTLGENFAYDKYHEANIVYKNFSSLDKTSLAYLDKVKGNKDILEDKIKNRPSEVIKKIKDDAGKKIDNAQNKLDKGIRDLEDNEKKIKDSEVLLRDGFKKYQDSKNTYETMIAKGQRDLEKAKVNLDEGRSKLEDAKKAYQINKKDFDNKITRADYELASKESDLNLGFAKLDKPQKELSDGYAELKENYDNSIAKLNEAMASISIDEANLLSKKSELDQLKSQEESEENKDKIQKLEADISYLEEIISKSKNLYETNKSNLDQKYNEEKYKLDQALGDIRAKEDGLIKAKNQLALAKEDFNKEKSAGEAKLFKAKDEISANEKKLRDGEKSYKDGLQNLEIQKENGRKKLEEAYRNLLDKEEELNKAKKKIAEEKAKADKDINKARGDIKESKEALLSLVDPEYKVESILDNQGIDTYYKNSLNMDKLSKVFPAFFYLVAMLVTLTTMKRYIEEQRAINGTLKSLGYSDKDIAKRFYIYGLEPTLCGAVIGAILGRFAILPVIFKAYSTGFGVGEMDISKSLVTMALAIVVSTFLIALTVRISSSETVKEAPANLLRRKTPDSGTKILLERIRPIWKSLSFMQKITARNLFRYKSRMFMTIFGVGGCTALLFFGFAMIDAIKDTSKIQQEEIFHYESVSIVNTSSKKEDIKTYERELARYENLPVYNKRAKLKNGKESLDLSIIIPEDDNKLKDFVSLRDLDNNSFSLSDKKVVLTENIAKKLGFRVNDTIDVDLDGDKVKLKVGAISENYIGDYLYISNDYYKEKIKDKLNLNSSLIKGNPQNIKESLDDKKAVDAVINKTGAYESMDALLSNLNLVISVITFISSALAIVVLYNITSINVGERKRELATVKVLGFFPKEVTSYIYREIFILTILGIFAGYILGYVMFRYILDVVAPAEIMLAYRTHPISYIISGTITLLISLVILIFVHKDLKKIDMAEAMSSGE